MITKMTIENFKCFQMNEVFLEKATLLLGTNSGGKSSFIQALLLSKMSLNGKSNMNLLSNDYGLNLHSFDEIINSEGEDFFKVVIQNESSLDIVYKSTDDSNILNIEVSGNQEVLGNPVIYLSADRSVSKTQIAGDVNNLELGNFNEQLAFIIEKGKQKNKIPFYSERNYWDAKNTQLFDMQVNDWLNYILPSNSVTSKKYGDDNLYALLFGHGRPMRQGSVGYGVSFILPIIVACLIADKESILVIENPELHLHPKAQSNMASFLATIAASGVQLVIETHSDHIINGFRKSILRKEVNISNTDIIINYFNNENQCNIEKVSLNEKAEIVNWPTGFMDQEEFDLFEMRKLRRNHE